METNLKFVHKDEPENTSQYGRYLCLVKEGENEGLLALSWGLRGWWETGVGCYGEDGEEVIAHVFLEDIKVSANDTNCQHKWEDITIDWYRTKAKCKCGQEL